MAINQLIGEKISALRTLKNISPLELAEKSGMSSQQLNLIESGITIPSLGILIRITRAMGIRLGTLLDDATEDGPAIRHASEHKSAFSFSTNENTNREHLTFYSLAPNMTGRHMEPFMIDIVPDGKDHVTQSSHEGEEFLYVLEGTVTVHYGNKIFELQQGDSIYLDSIVSHLVTTTSEKARILGIVYVPV